MSKEQLKSLKKSIEKLFSDGFTADEIISEVGIGRKCFKSLRKQDQMFDHHIIKSGG